MKYYIITLLVTILFGSHAGAQDSLATTTAAVQGHTSLKQKMDNIGHTKLFNATYLGIPLIAGGLIVKHQDVKFRGLRNDIVPLFHYTLDNFTQYAPLAAMLSMKSAGVQGRSSWGRMLLSDVFSGAIMGATVNTLKITTNVKRPDGSNNHSFPSGHTAMAFMAATMLNKEYGDISPLIGVGAYSMATATGLMRMANNKHWLSDVMVGAGIGILSTEFGYWLADAICKDKGLTQKHAEEEVTATKPSFLGMYMGFNIPLSHYDMGEGVSFKTTTGTTIGMEGAYFLNQYIGFGGRTAMSRIPIIIRDQTYTDNSFTYGAIYAGSYLSLPITPRWRLMTKQLIGYVGYRSNDINGHHLDACGQMSGNTGISLDYHVREHLGVNMFLDYSILPPPNKSNNEYMHIMTLGSRIAYVL